MTRMGKSLSAAFLYNTSPTSFNKISLINKRGIEDIRLEVKAKAKDTKKSEAKAKCKRPRPRTQAQVFSKKRPSKKFKKGLQKIFQAFSKKKTFAKNFSGNLQNLNNSIVLSSSQGQDNFRGHEASRQGQRLDLQSQGQRTSKCVLKDSTSAN